MTNVLRVGTDARATHPRALGHHHLGNAQQCFGSAERRLDKFEQRLAVATGEETAAPARAPERKVTQLELRVPGAAS